jgi:hypothetical protein
MFPFFRTSQACLVFSYILTTPWSGFAQDSTTITEPEEPGITIRVYNYAEVPMQTLRRAQKQAAAVLDRAGVTTRWLNCLPAVGVEKDPACREPKGPTDLVLRTLSRSMAQKLEIPASDLRFGYALQAGKGRFGSIAGVFPYRVEELAKETARYLDISAAFRAVLLGYLMAHEIGHLLLGSGSHSFRGIMRARWEKQDLEAAAQGSLGFTARQGEQMREQIRDRVRALERALSAG